MIHPKIEERLSKEQQQPFLNMHKHTCILAAAGSGKTRVLSYMIANDILNGVQPSQIIAFTFTEKAATELYSRVYKVVSELSPNTDIADIKISTIHAWCMDYLLNDSQYYGYVGMDELQQVAMVTRIYDHLELESAYGKPFPKGVDDFIADLEVLYNEHFSLHEVPEEQRQAIEKYLIFLKQNRLMDFGYMVRSAVELLKEKGPISNLSKLYIDEYQDVNHCQVLLAKHMANAETNICVVGDDLQCIYNWRGSDVTNIINFTSEFPDSATYSLTTNYRSHNSIVDAANISSNLIVTKARKPAMTAKHKDENNFVTHITTPNEHAEANAIVDLIKSFVEQGYEYKDICILLRSVRRNAQNILEALEREGIPTVCTVINRGTAFIDTFLVPLLTFLSFNNEPKNEQEEEVIELLAVQLEANALEYSRRTLESELFWQQVDKWRDLIIKGGSEAYNVRDCLYNLMRATGIALDEDDIDLTSGVGIASQIIRSVEEAHRRRLDFQPRRTPQAILNEIVINLVRWREDFGESIPLTTWKDGILVSTVHQSKGLEWPIVIMPAMVRNCFPGVIKAARTSFDVEINRKYGTRIDDERRLFYVAITRAKSRLIFTDFVETNHARRSSFISDLGIANTYTYVSEFQDTYFKITPADEQVSEVASKIGLSDLLILIECPFQYGLRKRAGVQPAVGDELGYGKGLHELIQRRIESKVSWDDEVLNEQVNTYVFLPLMSLDGENKSKEAIKSRIKEIQKIDIFDGEFSSEVDIQLNIGGAIVSGIIDGIMNNADGSVSIVDWKANLHEQFLPRYERQMRFYAYALSKKGYNVKEAFIVDVTASSKAKALVRHDISLQTQAIDEFLNEIQEAISFLRNELFVLKPGLHLCCSCDIARICRKAILDDNRN